MKWLAKLILGLAVVVLFLTVMALVQPLEVVFHGPSPDYDNFWRWLLTAACALIVSSLLLWAGKRLDEASHNGNRA